MEKDKTKCTLSLKRIFRCMMEDGYYPKYCISHIIFDLDDNTASVDFRDGIVSVRLFFSIEKEDYDIFLEVSNTTMIASHIVKPVIMDKRDSIMFSCELICFNTRDFRKNFPKGLELLMNTIEFHKKEMKRMLLAKELSECFTDRKEETDFPSNRKSVS